jgi:hypothetical protein
MSQAMNPASSVSSVGGTPRPKQWEKWVLYAYLRMMGATQKDAGSAVGRAKRTVQDWEQATEWYAQARDEARQRWLVELTDAARLTLLTTIRKGHGVLALQVLERLDEAFAPAKHTPEQPLVDLHLHIETAQSRMTDRLTRLATRHAEDGANGH